MGVNTTRRKKGGSINLSCDTILSPEFYKKIMPSLTFGDGPHMKELSHAHPPNKWKKTISAQGVVDLQPTEVWGEDGIPKDLFGKLSNAMTKLKENKLPIWLVGCSKEAQLLMRLIASYVKTALHKSGYENTGDYAIFFVSYDAKGWIPHRDRDALKNALEPDGLPNYITAWMPITNATPKSSCLYFIPRMHDITYETDEEDYMTKIFTTYESYQNILSLPMTPGGLICFTSRVIHWGSKPLQPLKGEKPVYEPRQAVSITIANNKFEKPSLSRKGAIEYPTFLESVVLATSLALRYNHQNPISTEHANCFKKIITDNIDILDTDYKAVIEQCLS